MRSVSRPHLSALAATRPRYVQLSGYVQASAASCSLALLEGRSYLVVPVVAMVGGSVVRGMNSKGPEYVPPEVLANFPESFNGRPIVPVHPYDGTGSANDPSTQNKYRYGQVFNARVEPGESNLKLDAWLDIDRATALGGDPASVVADCQAGNLVQVSLGAWIVMTEETGETADGITYEYVWQYITSYDHLAMGLAGDEGACSVEMGCGGPRVYTASGELASLALAKARRPTFNGTETTTWSAPSWHEWVTALHTGTESPKSITDATAALKASIARHTLLGDPNADNARDLTMFPVVNPHSGKLNERALRAVLGGRGSAADIPDAAKSSAQSMARALLKSEFDVEIAEPSAEEPSAVDSETAESDPKESANMAVPATAPDAAPAPASIEAESAARAGKEKKSLLARASASFAAVIRSLAASATGISDDTLRANLYNALRASEPAFGWGTYYWNDGYSSAVVDIYQSTSTVLYVTCPYDDVLYWIQTYTVGANGEVTLNGDRQRVEYRPVPIAATPATDGTESVTEMPVGEMSASATSTASAPACGCAAVAAAASNHLSLSTPATGDPAAASTETTLSTGGPSPMTPTPAVRTLVARLVANSGGVFTADSITALEALPEAQLTAMCEKFAPASTPTVAPTTPAVNTAETATATPVAPAVTPEASANAAATADTAAATTAPESFDALLARSPVEFQAFYAQGKAAMEQRKTTLLAAISAKSKATAAMLTAAPVGIEQLEAVATELGCFTPATPSAIPSYMGLGLPTSPLPTVAAYQVPKPYDVAMVAAGHKPLTPPRPGSANPATN